MHLLLKEFERNTHNKDGFKGLGNIWLKCDHISISRDRCGLVPSKLLNLTPLRNLQCSYDPNMLYSLILNNPYERYRFTIVKKWLSST